MISGKCICTFITCYLLSTNYFLSKGNHMLSSNIPAPAPSQLFSIAVSAEFLSIVCRICISSLIFGYRSFKIEDRAYSGKCPLSVFIFCSILVQKRNI